MDRLSPYLNWIDQQQDALEDLLIRWCNVNSGSDNLQGLEQMLGLLAERFASLGAELYKVALPAHTGIDDEGRLFDLPQARALHLSKRPNAPLRIFFGGHMDTVYGPDHPFQKAQRLENNILRGPGAADMKGGLLVLLIALEAFERHPDAHHIGWELVINPDEETGSIGSEQLLLTAARKTQIALLFEPSFSDGALVSSRKGSANWTLIARGKAAHAGRDFHQGCNAIHALAEFISRLHRLYHKSPVTINFGQIKGGGPVNIVPDFALCRFNVRYAHQTIAEKLEQDLAALVEQLSREDPRLTLELHLMTARKPKPFGDREQKLLDQFNAAAQEEGYTLQSRPSGGVCDGNLLAEAGLPVLDTLGVIGGEIHTDREYLLLDSLIARARLTARYLMTGGWHGA